jgi:hypothetical protein
MQLRSGSASLPPQWNHSLQQCCAAIFLFALATVLTQQAELGVVLLGMVRAFALLVFVAGGVMWPLAMIRNAQHARRADAKEPMAKVSFSSLSQQCLPRSVHHRVTPAPTHTSRTPAEAWPTSRSRRSRLAVEAGLLIDAEAFFASPPTEAEVELEAQEGSADRASAMMSRLLRSGPRPAGAFCSVVRAQAAAGRPAQASEWLNRMLAEGLRPEAHLFNAVMSAYVCAADTAGARALLDRMAQLQWSSLRWVQGYWASQFEDCC